MKLHKSITSFSSARATFILHFLCSKPVVQIAAATRYEGLLGRLSPLEIQE